MTSKQTKLIENYVRHKVKKMLKEISEPHYKLIKVYPGSPEIGTIVKISNNAVWFVTGRQNEFRGLKSSNEITKFPEFWRQVK